MCSTKLKQLYMASSIGELNTYTHVSFKLYQARLLSNSAAKVFTEAENCRKDGDEEKAYVLYMKFFSIYQAIKKSPDFTDQKKFCEEMIGPNKMKSAVEWVEKLQSSLQRRYEIEQERKLQEKTTIFTTNGSSGHSKTSPGNISCKQLYDLLKDEKVKVLLLDSRSVKDFEESHIKYSSCMNIPEDIIQPGMTDVRLEKLLPRSSKYLWEEKERVDYIILLDWFSNLCDVTQNSKLQWLKDAIFKWDSCVMLKSEPLILDGGYENWIFHYPMCTTNAKVQIPQNTKICDSEDITRMK